MEIAKNAVIDGKMMDIITHKDYVENTPLYANTSTAIETECDGKMYALPYRNPTDDRPGIYDEGLVYFVKPPEPQEAAKYDMNVLDVVDYSDSMNMNDFLTKRKQIRDIEAEMLTDIDNVFQPVIGVNDREEMKALKNAVILKQCDINKYSQRFGSNFLNEKRIFKQPNISMDKMIRIAQNLDMEVELIIRDKNRDVPNPMRQEVRAILTGGNDE